MSYCLGIPFLFAFGLESAGLDHTARGVDLQLIVAGPDHCLSPFLLTLVSDFTAWFASPYTVQTPSMRPILLLAHP